ncbi:ArsR/SmtB family transcription factor [Sphingopyxis kveilinensis]|uniref:ArsR/SmtB family transcription factor n=1 Tax=Sphingopyxis kveilinensis TaxID=3114367 RepID=UPI0030CE48B8
MKDGPDIARIANLIGDPARANMLTALMAGKALTASELANEAGVTQQTASSHLRKLEEGRLISPRKQGRHRYFALADERIARSLEALMDLAQSTGHIRTRTGPRDARLREARVCYNHLAGQMATRLYDHMIGRGYLKLSVGGLALTTAGESFARSLGIDIGELSGKRGRFCRECLDWSERRSHLAGSLGRAILTQIIDHGWAERDANSRAILFSSKGRAEFERMMAA